MLSWERFGHWQETRHILRPYSTAGQVCLIAEARSAGGHEALRRPGSVLAARGTARSEDAPAPPAATEV